MPGDMTRPRKKKYSLEDIKNNEQRALASYIKPIMDGMTMRQFANAEPKISLATVSNIFAPNYNGVPTARLLKLLAQKISTLSGDKPPEVIYEELLELCGYLKKDYPYDKPLDSNLSLTEATIMNAVLMRVMNLPIKGTPKERFYFEKKLSNGAVEYYGHDLTIDYSDIKDIPLDYWLFDIQLGTFVTPNVLRDSFYRMLNEETSNNAKYSIVTDSETLFNELSFMAIPALNLYVSAILYKDGIFKESYAKTALSQEEIDKLGFCF
jgi:hypothetical protein